MEILDGLQDIRARNARHERVAAGPGAEAALEARPEAVDDEEELRRKQEEEEDDAVVRQYFSKLPSASTPGTSKLNGSIEETDDDNTQSAGPSESSQHTITVKRKADFLEPDLDAMMSQAAKAAMPKIAQPSKKKKTDMASKLGIKAKPKVKT